MPLVLLLFTIICALPVAAGAVVPSAIAQEEDDDDMSLDEEGGGDLASGIVSNVLDNGNTAGDDTNTQLSVPLIDQDETAENRAVNLDLEFEDVDDLDEEADEEPPDEEPPGDEVVFCVTSGGPGFAEVTECATSLEVCQNVQAIIEAPLGRDLIQGCEFPEPPEGAFCVDPVAGTSNPCP